MKLKLVLFLYLLILVPPFGFAFNAEFNRSLYVNACMPEIADHTTITTCYMAMRPVTTGFHNRTVLPPDLQAQTIKSHAAEQDVVSNKKNENDIDMITLLTIPSTNEIHISSENKDIHTIELELLNALGQQVVKSKINMHESPAVLRTEDLPNGNYQVRIRCRNFLIYKKVIITK